MKGGKGKGEGKGWVRILSTYDETPDKGSARNTPSQRGGRGKRKTTHLTNRRLRQVHPQLDDLVNQAHHPLLPLLREVRDDPLSATHPRRNPITIYQFPDLLPVPFHRRTGATEAVQTVGRPRRIPPGILILVPKLVAQARDVFVGEAVGVLAVVVVLGDGGEERELREEGEVKRDARSGRVVLRELRCAGQVRGQEGGGKAGERASTHEDELLRLLRVGLGVDDDVAVDVADTVRVDRHGCTGNKEGKRGTGEAGRAETHPS